MKLTVVIVNYNVEYFLEQCLYSVEKAMPNINGEVYVVDNASVDGSVEMVRSKFSWVKLIANEKNTGFSVANNQAIRMAAGEYILLLNPDTLVEEDTFEKVIEFMDTHTDAGGLGVKMIDGQGKFLPESKRGLPTPMTAFYKIFGISSIFKKSKKFNYYHLGHLNNDEIHEIDVLSGACMFLRKEALEKIGLLDETFFMYGEDIDLSYRISKGGYKNYYYPNTSIIHYKGESTKKGSLNYVFVFYNAMIIFAKKHFSSKNAKLFSFFINIAIYLRAGVSIITRFIKKAFLPVVDFLALFGLLWLIKNQYQTYSGKLFPENLILIAFVIYSCIWLIGVYLSSGYERPTKPINLFKGVLFSTVFILVGYSLLPEHFRFSRAILLMGGAVATIYFLMSRVIFGIFNRSISFSQKKDQRFLIIGSEEESSRIVNLLNQTSLGNSFTRLLNPAAFHENLNQTLYRLKEIISVDEIDEVVFCAKDVSSQEIINIMARLEEQKVDFKIAPPESLFIIGSNSIKNSGDLFILDLNALTSPANRRNKRILDFLLSFSFLLTYPIICWFIQDKGGFLRNIFKVMFAKRTWVGFCSASPSKLKLPSLKQGIISPLITLKSQETSDSTKQKLNIVYARNYKISTDLSIIQKGFRYLGSQMAV